MWAKVKDFLSRVRVRLSPLIAMLVLALPSVLDQLGLIDLHPLLDPIFGDKASAAMVTLMTIVLSLLKPLIKLRPPEQPMGEDIQ